jgi:hypothetical protein
VVLRRVLAILCVGTLSVVPYGVARAATTMSREAVAKICNVASDCPRIDAIARPTATAHDISSFLDELWVANFHGGPAGPYQLQRCENPGPAPYRVECVLFSTGTTQDLAALRNVFESSRLFTSVDAVD